MRVLEEAIEERRVEESRGEERVEHSSVGYLLMCSWVVRRDRGVPVMLNSPLTFSGEGSPKHTHTHRTHTGHRTHTAHMHKVRREERRKLDDVAPFILSITHRIQ